MILYHTQAASKQQLYPNSHCQNIIALLSSIIQFVLLFNFLTYFLRSSPRHSFRPPFGVERWPCGPWPRQRKAKCTSNDAKKLAVWITASPNHEHRTEAVCGDI